MAELEGLGDVGCDLALNLKSAMEIGVLCQPQPPNDTVRNLIEGQVSHLIRRHRLYKPMEEIVREISYLIHPNVIQDHAAVREPEISPARPLEIVRPLLQNPSRTFGF